MKKIFVWVGSISIFLLLIGAVFFFSSFSIVPSPVPPPASEISVATANPAMASAILEDVEAMLLKNPEYYSKRAQDIAANTEYMFRLNATCAQAIDLIEAVTKVIRRHTDAPVRCTDPA